MLFGKKSRWGCSLLAGCFLVLLASVVAQATEVTLTATDMGNGGVLFTASASTTTKCCYVYWGTEDCTTYVQIHSPNVCLDWGEGSASCTGIKDRGNLHGTHTFEAYATDCKKNTVSTTTTITFDNTPSVSVTSPSGTVFGPFDITGTATFTPSLRERKGTIYACIDYSGVATKTCTTETCTFSFQELYGRLFEWNHGGPYTIRLMAEAYPTTILRVEDTGSFSVNKTPSVSITSPLGGRVKTPFEIAGTATFRPTLGATKGSIAAYINNGYHGAKTCTTETCEFSYKELNGDRLYSGNVGQKAVLRLTATGGGVSASDEREIFVEALEPDPGCPDPPPGTCPLPCIQ